MNSIGFIIVVMFFLGSHMDAVTHEQLTVLNQTRHPFSYDLGLTVIPSKYSDAPVMICMHGMGGDYRIIQAPQYARGVKDHLVSFNFPDYRCMRGPFDPRRSVFGSIEELLPALYVIKQCVVDAGMQSINLYGFSAGGGALINILGILNSSRFSQELCQLGITASVRKRMRDAIVRGVVILDCPLKSVEEIIDFRGEEDDLVVLAERYRQNNMRPLDMVEYLKGIRCTMILYFNEPDEILSNRDDLLFIKRLRAHNAGKTHVVIGQGGGHNTDHPELWKTYTSLAL